MRSAMHPGLVVRIDTKTMKIEAEMRGEMKRGEIAFRERVPVYNGDQFGVVRKDR
jgi:hypothetical protein